MPVFSSDSAPVSSHTRRRKRSAAGGSLTVFFALTFAVMMSLITAAIYSSKVEAGKARLASAARQSIESVFARYDISLSDCYQLYFVDGGCGTDTLQTDRILTYMDSAAGHLLNPRSHHTLPGSSFLSLKDSSVSLDGITMATDLDGTAFRAQAVQSVKDLPVTAVEKDAGSGSGPGSSSSPGRRIPESYDGTVHGSVDDLSDDEKSQASSLYETARWIIEHKDSLLSSAVLDGKTISARAADLSSALSRRSLQSGFGVIETAGSAESNHSLLFREYLLRHMGRYGHDLEEASVLSYEAEYLFAGQGSDSENLKAVIRKLFWRRFTVNKIFLRSDPAAHAMLTKIATDFGLLIGRPDQIPLIQWNFEFAWASAESLVDLRSLYDGNRIARAKTKETWQTPIESLSGFFRDPGSLEIPVPGGMDYRQALKDLLGTVKQKTLTLRAMDLIEWNIRAMGHEHFFFDHCFDSMRVTLRATAQQDIPAGASCGFSFRTQR